MRIEEGQFNFAPPSRRAFLVAAAAGSAARGAGWSQGQAPQAAVAAALDAARRQAAHRRRRVIFNNDGDDIWAEGAATVENFLAVRHTPLLGTHVDSIFYCTTQSFNLFTHDARVAEVFQVRDGTFAHNNLPAFLEQKTDGLRMSSDFARQHGLESIWTLRMNDIHDAWTPAFVSRWKQEDPRRVMSTLEATKEFSDRRRLWSLVDFAHPDVEPRLLAIIEEVLRNYAIDGIELDFLRAPFNFRSSYEGRPATDPQIALLTGLMRNVRALVLRESQRQGKPFLLAVRAPVTAALCRKIGIDIAAWLQEQLVDVLALGGGYVVFDQPVRELIDLGHRHQIPVYPCLSQSGLLYRPPRGNGENQPPEAWFGAAIRLWDAGADGIYTFNLFPGPGSAADQEYARSILSRIGSKQDLLQANRLYAISDAGTHMPAHFWAKDAEEFSGALPVALKPGETTTVPLVVAETVRPAGDRVIAELRLDFTGLTGDSTPIARFNGADLTQLREPQAAAQVRRFTYRMPVASIKRGENRLEVASAGAGVQLVGAELWLRMGDEHPA